MLRLLETPGPGLLVRPRRRARFSELSVAERGHLLHALATARVPRLPGSVRRLQTDDRDRVLRRRSARWSKPNLAATGLSRVRLRLGPATRAAWQSCPVDSDTTLESDCVIVGSGAGGSVVAGELAARGWNVIVLEQGPQASESDFDQREVATLNRMYLDGGLAGTSDRGVSILAGRCLGGGTVVNFTTSFRTPESIRQEWQAMTGSPIFGAESYRSALDAVGERLQRQYPAQSPVAA